MQKGKQSSNILRKEMLVAKYERMIVEYEIDTLSFKIK